MEETVNYSSSRVQQFKTQKHVRCWFKVQQHSKWHIWSAVSAFAPINGRKVEVLTSKQREHKNKSMRLKVFVCGLINKAACIRFYSFILVNYLHLQLCIERKFTSMKLSYSFSFKAEFKKLSTIMFSFVFYYLALYSRFCLNSPFITKNKCVSISVRKYNCKTFRFPC